MDVIIYHNAACGTSRNVLAMIRNSGVEPHIIEYLKCPPTRLLLTQLLARGGLTAFVLAARYIRNRISVFISLPIRSLDKLSLNAKLRGPLADIAGLKNQELRSTTVCVGMFGAARLFQIASARSMSGRAPAKLKQGGDFAKADGRVGMLAAGRLFSDRQRTPDERTAGEVAFDWPFSLFPPITSQAAIHHPPDAS